LVFSHLNSVKAVHVKPEKRRKVKSSYSKSSYSLKFKTGPHIWQNTDKIINCPES